MIRCTRCVMPNTRPDTPFVDGVCAACLAYERRPMIDWDARRRELEALLERGRNGTGFDCIVPSSGGKDSTYQVLELLKLGARPLVVTATTCHLTGYGRANIDNLSRYATTIEVTPNRTVRAKLNRLGLELVGDISWPEHISIHRVPFRMAKALGIKLIFYGECPNEAYGGPVGTENTMRMTQRWVSEFGGFLGLRTQDVVGTEGITAADMLDYEAPNDVDLFNEGIEAHFLGQYVFWDSRHNADVAKAAGMQQQLPGPMNYWEAENQDNAGTGIHDFFCWLKYGYGRLAAQVSIDVRAGLRTRDEAMALVRERDGLFPLEYMGVPIDDVLGKIGMTREVFLKTCNTFTNFALFKEMRIEWGQHLTLLEFA